MANCSYCHGWKEFQFHPYEFRVNPCKPEIHCGGVCPYFHTIFEQRSPSKPFYAPLKMKLALHANINDQAEKFMQNGCIGLELNYVVYEEEQDIPLKSKTMDMKNKMDNYKKIVSVTGSVNALSNASQFVSNVSTNFSSAADLGKIKNNSCLVIRKLIR